MHLVGQLCVLLIRDFKKAEEGRNAAQKGDEKEDCLEGNKD